MQKYVDIFARRLIRGQCFQQPYLGCRELAATVGLADGSEQSAEELRGRTIDLGWMLHDVDYEVTPHRPRFFHAVLKDGVIEVPPWEGEVAA